VNAAIFGASDAGTSGVEAGAILGAGAVGEAGFGCETLLSIMQMSPIAYDTLDPKPTRGTRILTFPSGLLKSEFECLAEYFLLL